MRYLTTPDLTKPVDPELLPVCAGPGCERRLVSANAWAAIPKARRRVLRRDLDTWPHTSRGLCCTCHSRAGTDGTLIDYPTRRVPMDLVLQEWAVMYRDPTTSRKAQVRVLAPRLGMSVEALDKALDRARARGELAA